MSPKTITLYYSPLSQPSRSLYMFVKKNALPADFVIVDLLSNEHKTEKYLELNPNGAVPFITIKNKDGKESVLTESIAIALFLVGSGKMKDHWYPKDNEQRFKVNEYLFYHSTGIRQALVRVFLRETFMKEQMNRLYGEKKIVDDMKMELERLQNNFLKDKLFLATEKEISVADIFAANEIGQIMLTKYGEDLLDGYVKVKQWYKRVQTYFKGPWEEIYQQLTDLASTFPPPQEGEPIQLYYHPISQPSRTLYMFAKKNNLNVEFISVDILNGEHHTDKMKKLNPFEAVPFIRFKGKDGQYKTLTESVAIAQFFCDMNSLEEHWYPKDVLKRAKFNEYTSYHGTGVRQALVRCFLRETFMQEQMDQQYGEAKIIEDMNKEIARLQENFLGGNNFIASENDISIADLFVANEIGQMSLTKYGSNLLDLYPKLQKWYEQVKTYMQPHWDEIYTTLNETMAKSQQKPAEEEKKEETTAF